MAAAAREAAESPNPRSAPRRAAAAAAAKDASSFLSPRFRSAAAQAGWDEESLLHAALVVEDTPVRESRRRRRASTTSSSAGGGGSAGSNTRKRRSWRQPPGSIPPVVFLLDDDEKKPDTTADGKKEVKEEEKKTVVIGEKEACSEKAAATSELPCMDRLREELSCAICLEICFEPSTTPCGHSFCMKCLKHAAAKCGKRCPKCRQLISNSRSCTVNTVLWNTIQLLFPSETEARRTSIASYSETNDDLAQQISQRSNSMAQGGIRSSSSNGIGYITQRSTRSSATNNRSFTTTGSRRSTFVAQEGSSTATGRGFVRASQLVPSARVVSVRSHQSDDAALAYRLQQEEFMTAFESEGERQPPRSSSSTVSAARANLRAMASRAIRLRARGWPV
uniref:RING-type E3 ubiquitin transferase n=1 Tax=Oryza meridionalis TaxID=40149 RepID=A0A0E0FB39_9ORYZ